jgi:hypothetical protein
MSVVITIPAVMWEIARMAKTQVERQREFVERHVGVDKERLQFLAKTGTKAGLEKMAKKLGFKAITPFLEWLATDGAEKILENAKKDS